MGNSSFQNRPGSALSIQSRRTGEGRHGGLPCLPIASRTQHSPHPRLTELHALSQAPRASIRLEIERQGQGVTAFLFLPWPGPLLLSPGSWAWTTCTPPTPRPWLGDPCPPCPPLGLVSLCLPHPSLPGPPLPSPALRSVSAYSFCAPPISPCFCPCWPPRGAASPGHLPRAHSRRLCGIRDGPQISPLKMARRAQIEARL